MFITARQLQDQHRASGTIALPAGARLTPLAIDFLRLHQITPMVSPTKSETQHESDSRSSTVPSDVPTTVPTHASSNATSITYWCGTPSGIAKAAIMNATREFSLQPIGIPEEPTQLSHAVKMIALRLGLSNGSGSIIVVEHAGLATILANRHQSVRAVVATSLASLKAALNQASANVLIIEPAALPLAVLSNLINHFCRGIRPISADVQSQLEVRP